LIRCGYASVGGGGDAYNAQWRSEKTANGRISISERGQLQPRLASGVVGRSFSFSIHYRTSLALGAFGQVSGSALLRNTIAPSVANQNS
jgi:hypothetical protein